jgi:hypothetical protein
VAAPSSRQDRWANNPPVPKFSLFSNGLRKRKAGLTDRNGKNSQTTYVPKGTMDFIIVNGDNYIHKGISK